MELKSDDSKLDGFNASSQSHLYGIEIDFYQDAYLRITGPNRTFMELKYTIASEQERRKASQSHLYGIEINALELRQRGAEVPIAPLWN